MGEYQKTRIMQKKTGKCAEDYSFAGFEVSSDSEKNKYAFRLICDNNHEGSYIDFVIAKHETD